MHFDNQRIVKFKHMKYLLFAILLCSIVSCKSKQAVTTPEQLKKMDKNEAVMSLHKSACFGSCPVYSFYIYKNGETKFEGLKNTKKIGIYAKQLDRETYNSLVDAFDEADFFGLQDMYESRIADLPSVKMSYMKDDSIKYVTGKRERPERVHKLQYKLEQIAESDEGWTLIEGTPPVDNTPKLIKSEIIIVTKGGPQLAKWFDKMRVNHGVRIKKRLSASSDKWLISYDPKKQTPEEMLNILQTDEFVNSAEYNVETEKR